MSESKRWTIKIWFLQSLPVPKQLWEDISMDFIMGMPPTPRGYDAIYTFVD